MLLPRRVLTGLAAATAILGLVPALGYRVWARQAAGVAFGAADAEKLEIFYTPPVLARAGEALRIPVDVVCATPDGEPCKASVTLGSRVGSEAWQTMEAPAAPRLQFDLTAPAARALASRPSGASVQGWVDFFIRATGPSGRQAMLGQARDGAFLRAYVLDDLPALVIPPIPFGSIRHPRTVLSLPWGSGPMRAGLSLGKEGLTLGPSSFDVDRSGRIYLLDALQQRVAVFTGGKLAGEVALHVGPRSDIAVGAEGEAYVMDSKDGSVTVRRIDPSGSVNPSVTVGDGIGAQIRTAGGRAFVDLLPLDAWVPVAASNESASSAEFTVGRPNDDGTELLRVGNEASIRLATVSSGGAERAVELRSSLRLGEVALAEPDGHGGYWVVVHVWRDGRAPEDQYQIVHVEGGRIVLTFAVGDRRFAETPILSKFRLGPDGLYQMTTSPRGMRIVRYELGEGA